jgi:predicted MFS family arabinose efflux permease
MAFLTRRSAQTIAVLAVTQLIGWGTSFEVLGVMGRIIAPELALPNEVIFGGLTVMMIVSAFAGLALSTNAVVYLLAWIVIGLGGALGLSAPAYTAVVEREGPDAKRIIAILMLFTGLSVTIFWPLLALFNDLVGWRLTFAACAALQLFVCVPLYLFALPKPLAVTAEGQTQAQRPPVPLSEPERRQAFLLVACAVTISSFVTFGLAPALLELLQQAGATPELALQLAAARGVFGISARFVDMLLGKRGSPLLTASAGCLLILGGLALLLAMPGSTAGLWVFMLLYGFGSGIFAVARAVLPLALFSPREFGLQSARLSLPQNLANAAAPVIFTALLDRLGYQAATVFAGGLACVALLSIVLLVRLVRQAHARPPVIPSPPETAARP